MRLTFDSEAKPGERLVSVLVNGNKIMPEQTYTLATTNYLFEGGDGYTPLAMGSQMKDSIVLKNILISDLVQRDIRLKGKLSSKIDNRIVDVAQQNNKGNKN
jgi:2',3'-cyclic-nucleotide 2'-phosphodiesterase (5'-nucleotidase family)